MLSEALDVLRVEENGFYFKFRLFFSGEILVHLLLVSWSS